MAIVLLFNAGIPLVVVVLVVAGKFYIVWCYDTLPITRRVGGCRIIAHLYKIYMYNIVCNM